MTISGWAEQYFMDPERFYPVKVWVKLLAALMFVFFKWISVVRILRYVLMIHFRSVWKDLAFILLFGILVKGSLLLCSSCNYVASWILKEDLMTIHEHNYPNIYTILYKIYTVYIYTPSVYLFDINSSGCCQCQDSDDAWQLATKDVPSSLLPEALGIDSHMYTSCIVWL